MLLAASSRAVRARASRSRRSYGLRALSWRRLQDCLPHVGVRLSSSRTTFSLRGFNSSWPARNLNSPISVNQPPPCMVEAFEYGEMLPHYVRGCFSWAHAVRQVRAALQPRRYLRYAPRGVLGSNSSDMEPQPLQQGRPAGRDQHDRRPIISPVQTITITEPHNAIPRRSAQLTVSSGSAMSTTQAKQRIIVNANPTSPGEFERQQYLPIKIQLLRSALSDSARDGGQVRI